ncbi:unnamed protein product [Calicophoron daubneyi]|uniref:Ribosomal protein S18 n=1 Tax=Calicophoron daubneyi TaxID=300641 RepID=A0AAV2T2P3_CALDB
MIITWLCRLPIVSRLCSHQTLMNGSRSFRTTTCRRKKEIRYHVDKNRTTIEGVLVPSERQGKVVCLDGFGDARDTDPISRLGLRLRHTDVRILSQFLRPDGTILPRSVTGISMSSHLVIEMLVDRAKKAGLLPLEILPTGEHRYLERSRHRFNVYYDSDTIGLPKAAKKSYRYEPPE